MSRSSGRRAWSPALAIAGATTVGLTFGYARLLAQQGDWPGPDDRQSFVLAFLVAAAITAVIGAVTRTPQVRVAAAAACATGLLPLGFLSLFSIGIVVLMAGAMAAAAWVVAAAEAPIGAAFGPSTGGAIVAGAVLVVGLIVT